MTPDLTLADLPIRAHEEEILHLLKTRQVLILSGETGSGKTTQIPKLCLKAGFGESGKIAVTQPRRVAAISLARRVAEETGTSGSDYVAHKVRFDDRTGQGTRVVFATDGALLAELGSDRQLSQYSCIIVDEAHERSLNIDFLIGILRQILSKRNDLHVIVSSATIDVNRFAEAFRDAQGPAPVVSVEGRTYPVDILYRDEMTDPDVDEEETLAERAATACSELLALQSEGDLLCFLPGEREIRDTARELEKHPTGALRGIEIVPLYGRLSAADQDRVFHPAGRRRVILSTNVAETSVTVPRVRLVVDAGLVRLSRYASRTRTKRLLLEPASQASARQRAGRCGRIGPGICLRLYSREDFESREPQTPPEVQRSDLSEVILRMLELGLGAPENFPFLDPPENQALNEGWRLLQELEAVDDEGRLTRSGHHMAKLPLDPRSARILLRSRDEHCLADVLVLVAGLAIPDPRERPEGKEQQARQAQAHWDDRQSDFFTLLNLWEEFSKEVGDGSGNRLRKFCKDHYLSYPRLRDWRESVRQLRELLRGSQEFRGAVEEHGDYGQIHRSLLTGFLSNLCRLDEEASARAQRAAGRRRAAAVYRATRGRSLKVWPGSVLAAQRVTWLLAAEIVETTQLWARTTAEISPEWIESAAGDLLRAEYSDPRWDGEGQRVVTTERLYLWGLPVASGRLISCTRVDPALATEIFCREALVPGLLRTRYGFLDHNRKLRQEIDDLEAKLRRRVLYSGDEALTSWYRQRLPDGIGSSGDLNGWLRKNGGDATLQAAREDLIGDPSLLPKPEDYPDRLRAGTLDLPLSYLFDPGSEADGITLSIALDQLSLLPDAAVEWLVPGLLPERIEMLIRGLARPLRQNLPPPAALAREAAAALAPQAYSKPLREALAAWLKPHVTLSPASFPAEDDLEPWLRLRVEVLDAQNKVIATSRDLSSLRRELSRRIEEAVRDRLASSREAVLREGLQDWPEDLIIPVQEKISASGGLPLTVFPGLYPNESGTELRRFPTASEAARSHDLGVRQLLSHVMTIRDKTFAWLPRDLRLPQNILLPLAAYAPARAFEVLLYETARDWCFEAHRALPTVRDPAAFAEAMELCTSRVRTVRAQCEPFMHELIAARRAFEAEAKRCPRFAALAAKIRGRLWPADFPKGFSWSAMMHLPRFWQAAARRLHVADTQPPREKALVAELTPFVRALDAFCRTPVPPRLPGELAHPDRIETSAIANFLVEELRVQLWAQELNTTLPASPKRIRTELAALGISVSAA